MCLVSFQGPIQQRNPLNFSGFCDTVRLIGLKLAPPKTFKNLSTPDKESFSKTPTGV